MRGREKEAFLGTVQMKSIRLGGDGGGGEKKGREKDKQSQPDE